MFTFGDYFESVEDVWAAWFAAMAALLVLSGLFGPRLRPARLWRFSRDERGAAYSLSVVMILPTYIFLICTVIECTLILQVKIGSMYAAFAAARAAAVQLPARSSPAAMEKIKLAAVQAITPFASARDMHLAGAGTDQGPPTESERAWFDVYQQHAGGSMYEAYLIRKRRYSQQAVTVRIFEDAKPYSGAVRVEVEYEMPMNLPITGGIFGSQASWPGAPFRTRKVVSTVAMHVEWPASESETLGIQYDADH